LGHVHRTAPHPELCGFHHTPRHTGPDRGCPAAAIKITRRDLRRSLLERLCQPAQTGPANPAAAVVGTQDAALAENSLEYCGTRNSGTLDATAPSKSLDLFGVRWPCP
jgi:hypothetical protein